MNPFAFMLASLGGTLFGAFGGYRSGKEERRIRYMNARLLEERAVQERKVARQQARYRRTEAHRLKARQIVLFAKSGVSPAGGTPLQVYDESMRRMEEQAAIIQQHGQFAYEQGMSEAALERKRGRAASKAGTYSAFASLATGLGGLGMDWYTYQNLGRKKRWVGEGIWESQG